MQRWVRGEQAICAEWKRECKYSVLTTRSFQGKTGRTTHATACESKGEPQCGHIPRPILGGNAQREDRASTAISNSSVLRQACLTRWEQEIQTRATEGSGVTTSAMTSAGNQQGGSKEKVKRGEGGRASMERTNWAGSRKEAGTGGGPNSDKGKEARTGRGEKEMGQMEESVSLKAGEGASMGGEEALCVAEIPQQGGQGRDGQKNPLAL